MDNKEAVELLKEYLKSVYFGSGCDPEIEAAFAVKVDRFLSQIGETVKI